MTIQYEVPRGARKESVKGTRLERAQKEIVREARVDKWLKRVVVEAGGVIFKVHPITDGGVPDRIVHFRKMTFYVEVKETNKPCEPLQIEQHARIKSAGTDVYVLDVKIKDIWELFTYCYTTYEGVHYKKNPHVKHAKP